MNRAHLTTDGKMPLRQQAQALRESLDPATRKTADHAMAQAVMESSLFSRAPLILAYCSFGSEVETHTLIEEALRQDKEVALPRCLPGTGLMTWHLITSLSDLAPGYGGILEPPNNPATLIDPRTAGSRALALVPGLLFDDAGYRLGYGGGYYDRFLASFPGTSLGLTRTAQRVSDLRALGAVESFDQPVHWVADETGLRSGSAAPTIL